MQNYIVYMAAKFPEIVIAENFSFKSVFTYLLPYYGGVYEVPSSSARSVYSGNEEAGNYCN